MGGRVGGQNTVPGRVGLKNGGWWWWWVNFFRDKGKKSACGARGRAAAVQFLQATCDARAATAACVCGVGPPLCVGESE